MVGSKVVWQSPEHWVQTCCKFIIILLYFPASLFLLISSLSFYLLNIQFFSFPIPFVSVLWSSLYIRLNVTWHKSKYDLTEYNFLLSYFVPLRTFSGKIKVIDIVLPDSTILTFFLFYSMFFPLTVFLCSSSFFYLPISLLLYLSLSPSLTSISFFFSFSLPSPLCLSPHSNFFLSFLFISPVHCVSLLITISFSNFL